MVNDEGNAEDDEDVGGSGGMTTGDGQHVLESTSLGATFTRQWERRSQSLFHPCAVAAWMLCPLQSIMKDSTANCTPEDAATLEEVVKVVTRNHPILGKSPAAVAATLVQFTFYFLVQQGAAGLPPKGGVSRRRAGSHSCTFEQV